MRDDTPDDLVHDVFAGALFARPPARPRDRGQPGQHRRGHARPGRRLPRRALPAVERRGGGGRERRPRRGREARRATRSRPTGTRGRPAPVAPTRPTSTGSRRVDRPLEQSHVVLGARALRRDDPDRFALAVVDQVLGGGMSSRLFQEIREKRGLAYSVFSYRSAFEETGALAVYCAHRARAGRRDARRRARRARPAGRRRRHLRPRARVRQGPPHRVAGAVAGELVESHAPHRAQRAHDGRDPEPRLGGRRRSTRSPPPTSPGSSNGCSRAGSRTLAVVGPADALDRRLNTAGRTPASADTLSR